MAEYSPFDCEFKNQEIVTLARFLKTKKENAPPRSFISTVLKPNKYQNWTFVCEHGFKVLVYENSPIFNDLKDFLENAAKNGEALFVKLLDLDNAGWTFVIDTYESAEWESKDFGWKCAISQKKSTPEKKSTRTKSRKSKAAEPSLPSSKDPQRDAKSPQEDTPMG